MNDLAFKVLHQLPLASHPPICKTPSLQLAWSCLGLGLSFCPFISKDALAPLWWRCWSHSPTLLWVSRHFPWVPECLQVSVFPSVIWDFSWRHHPLGLWRHQGSAGLAHSHQSAVCADTADTPSFQPPLRVRLLFSPALCRVRSMLWCLLHSQNLTQMLTGSQVL